MRHLRCSQGRPLSSMLHVCMPHISRMSHLIHRSRAGCMALGVQKVSSHFPSPHTYHPPLCVCMHECLESMFW